MNEALYIASTGLQAQKQHVDTIANNLANVSTPGFKRATVQFHDLMLRETQGETGVAGPARAPSAGVGVSISNVLKTFDPGELRRTDNPMQLAVQGEGFLEVQLSDGALAYTRGGGLMVNAQGMLATSEGHEFRPGIRVGRDIRDLRIAADGTVSGTDASGRTGIELGRLDLVMFASPPGLKPMGDNLYQASEASGAAIPIHPGDESKVTLAQGFEEASNVRLVDEMVALMVAQRAYEMNVKVIQAADDMTGMSNNLRR